MTSTRRTFLAAAAAAPLAAGLLPAVARAGSGHSHSAAQQVAGIQRRKVGEATVTALLDGYLDVAPALMSSYDAEAAGQSLARYGQTMQPDGLRIPVNGYLIEAGGKKTLIDTGTADLFAPTLGSLGANLAAAGVRPDDIDQVILTHMHVDHVGGLIDANGAAAFPNAELVVAQTEWDFWYSDEMRTAAGEGAAAFFQAARMTTTPYQDRLKLVSGEADLGGGLSTQALPGHTPGHQGVLLNSGNDSLLFWGDIIHMTAIQFAFPDVTLAFDTDAEVTKATRAKMLDMAAADGLRVTGAHLDFPGFGTVLREGDAYRFQAAPWDYAL